MSTTRRPEHKIDPDELFALSNRLLRIVTAAQRMAINRTGLIAGVTTALVCVSVALVWLCSTSAFVTADGGIIPAAALGGEFSVLDSTPPTSRVADAE